MAKDRRAVFSKLVVGMTIRHANGTCFKIVKVKEKKTKDGETKLKVYAKWRNGHIGRFGKEVVRITPAHIKGFLRYRARQHPPKKRAVDQA